MKSKRRAVRTGEIEYQTPEQRSPERHTELAAFIAGNGQRPDWMEYAPGSDGYWFGSRLLTPEEASAVRRRDDELDPTPEDDDALEPPDVPM